MNPQLRTYKKEDRKIEKGLGSDPCLTFIVNRGKIFLYRININDKNRCMSKKRFFKQIKSFECLILKHKEKIELEKAKSVPDVGLIKYWEKEIKVYMCELKKAKKRLNRGR